MHLILTTKHLSSALTPAYRQAILALILTLHTALPVYSQTSYSIETGDIDNFWRAYDQLASATSKKDSVSILQKEYIEKASDYFKEFLKARNFTATEYVDLISRYPKFWRSVRPLTENIARRKNEIQEVFETYSQKLPDYRQPDVCFAIGCLRTGGTTTDNLILIGAEIAASDSSVDKSEMSGWLDEVIGNTGDIVAMVAHEAVHTQQRNGGKNTLLTACLREGIADFVTTELLGLNINQAIYKYGDQHQCKLWKEFEADLEDNPSGISKWLYQGNRSGDRPADLGYYIGHKIAESYYTKQGDKEKALKTLLNERKYRSIFRKSEFSSANCK